MKGYGRMNKGHLFIISGPSGVGKTTLVARAVSTLAQEYPIAQGLTYTTRQPRPQEKDGQDYFFVSQADFKAKIGQNYFLEWSDAYGAFYGSPRDILQTCSQGHSRILILNWQGALQVYQQVPEAILIWITISDRGVLQERLQGRNANGRAEIEHRLNLALREMEQETREKRFHYHVLNDDFNEGYTQLTAILSHKLQRCATPGAQE